MVCDKANIRKNAQGYKAVLILVLMEYGLRRYLIVDGYSDDNVLILVLVEYGLRQGWRQHIARYG